MMKSVALIAVMGLLMTSFGGIPHPPVYSTGLTNVWQIGDVEEIDPATGHYTSYADEFNWQGFGNPHLPFTNPFVVGTTPENEFAYGPDHNDGYATDLTIQWYGEMPLGGQLTISWSPGKTAYETKTITFVDTGDTATFTEWGGYDYQKGWENYPLVEDFMTLSPVGLGWHEFRLLHTTGDGTFHDWIRLEAVEHPDEVEIDIKPGSDPNCFNNNGHGVIPVAILGSVTMDVTNIDPATVELEGLKVKRVGRWNKLLAHIEDVSEDGFDDMVVQIQDEAGAFPIGHSTATLT
ncbi:MAG: hypothetical protein KAU99_01520 [Thermoplasmata archaeon]|nr:hypothetical protein [Thermoplasmata archaeon]